MKNDQKKSPLILVVDDEQINVDILEDVLEDEYEIGTALNGSDAIAFAREKHPQLILLDISMPKMDGFEVIQELKKCDQTKDIAVIFITALSNIENKINGFELGAVDYISKPFISAEVESRIKAHLSLIDYRNMLEEKVTERTKELKAANSRLQKMEGLLASIQTASSLNYQIEQHLETIIKYLKTNQPPEKSISEVNSISTLMQEVLDKVSQSYDSYTDTEKDLSENGTELKEF